MQTSHGQHAWASCLRTGLLVSAALLLVACAGQPRTQSPLPPPDSRQPPAPVGKPPVLRSPIQRAPISAPAPRPPSSSQRTHPRYAPPPGAPSHWDNQLGVYVVEGASLYYRERLYYRWDGDWYCAGRPDGPWEPVAPSSVPPGLRNRSR